MLPELLYGPTFHKIIFFQENSSFWWYYATAHLVTLVTLREKSSSDYLKHVLEGSLINLISNLVLTFTQSSPTAAIT